MSEDYVKDCENCDHCDINAGMICVIQRCKPSFLAMEAKNRDSRRKTEKVQELSPAVPGKREDTATGKVLRKPAKKRTRRKKGVSKKKASK